MSPDPTYEPRGLDEAMETVLGGRWGLDRYDACTHEIVRTSVGVAPGVPVLNAWVTNTRKVCGAVQTLDLKRDDHGEDIFPGRSS